MFATLIRFGIEVEIIMKKEIIEFEKRNNLINCQKHPTLDLLIWNYNQRCQFEKKWDEYTIISRGLITDKNGNIVARPFKKYFNLNETKETKIENLPIVIPKITEKLDGSLGIQYYDGDKVCIATRGSFNSEQAIFATKWMEKFKKSDFLEGFTYLYEIIYPENRIVVDYQGKKELFLLAVKNTETGEEIDFKKEAEKLGVSYPKIINKDLSFLIKYLSQMKQDEEGFVLQYDNDFRIKMKGEEYLRLHRLITGFSTISIWDCLKNSQDLSSILQNVPDEFYNWIKIKEQELRNNFNRLKEVAIKGFENVKNLPNRKSQALTVLKDYKEISSAIFGLLDNKNIDEIIWKKLRPKYELPFKTDDKEAL